MKKKKYYLSITGIEVRTILLSLIHFKNKLQQQGHYTDCVDELILKISSL